MKSLEIVKSLIASYKKPLFLAGDMNAEPESDFIKELQKDFQILSNPEKHTYPAPDPKETIDYIAASKQNATGFAVISAKVVNELMASDHRPILVELRTAEKADKNAKKLKGDLANEKAQRETLIEKARRDGAEDARKAAEEAARAAAEKELEAEKAARQQAEANAAELAKQLKVAGDEDTLRFSLLFDRVQSDVDEMLALCDELRGDGKTEKAGKFSAALRKALESLAGAIETEE